VNERPRSHAFNVIQNNLISIRGGTDMRSVIYVIGVVVVVIFIARFLGVA
jgi:hypothetical protein